MLADTKGIADSDDEELPAFDIGWVRRPFRWALAGLDQGEEPRRTRRDARDGVVTPSLEGTLSRNCGYPALTRLPDHRPMKL
jgi:hypothetical protein